MPVDPRAFNDPPEIAAHFGQRVGELIDAGKITEAHDAVEEAFRAVAALSSKVTNESPVASILRPRIADILVGSGCYSIGQLCQHTRHTLAHDLQIRYRSIDIIETTLFEHGLRLRESDV